MAGAPITSLTKETPGLTQVWILERRSKNAESKRDKKNILASLLQGIKVYALNMKWKKNTLQRPRKRNLTTITNLENLFLRLFFLMWTIFKVFIEFVSILFLSYVLVFWPQSMWP